MGKLIDITGQKFRMLTVIKRGETRTHPNGSKSTMWVCRCDCGKEIEVVSRDLRSGHTTCCGHTHVKTAKDMTGQKFGKLTVLERGTDYEYKETTSPAWICKCDCGNIIIAQGGNLRSGAQTSCGCDKKYSLGEEKVIKLLNKYNISFKREYFF